jgi:hypothetical protein
MNGERDRLTTSDLARTPSEQDPVSADPAVGSERPASADRPDAAEDSAPLVDSSTADELRRRWDQIQTGFVDEPRKAVEDADSLVAEAMKRLAENFSSQRNELERQWDHGDQVSTEDLRQALRSYRSFFRRLLSM